MRSWLFIALSGCFAPVDGSGALAARAHDTRLDRTRVLGVRATPDVVVWDEPFVVETLVWSPTAAPSLRTEGCAWGETRPVRDITCFALPELVDPLGEGSPLTLTHPAFSAFDCEGATSDTGTDLPASACVAPLHLRVTATSPKDDHAVVLTLPSVSPETPGAARPPVGEVSLTSLGGAPVKLEARLAIPDDWTPRTNTDVVARWYSTHGVFLGTGRTTGVREDGGWRTENTLDLSRAEAAAVEVIVVVHVERGVWSDRPRRGADVRPSERWATLTLEAP